MALLPCLPPSTVTTWNTSWATRKKPRYNLVGTIIPWLGQKSSALGLSFPIYNRFWTTSMCHTVRQAHRLVVDVAQGLFLVAEACVLHKVSTLADRR